MRQSRRSFLDVLAGGRDSSLDAGHATGLWIAARGHEEYQAQAAQGATAPPRPSCRPASRPSASAATRIRSARARRRSTRSCASSPKRAGIRSTARRPTAPWSTRSRRSSAPSPRTSSSAPGRRKSSRARSARSRRRRARLVTAVAVVRELSAVRAEARASGHGGQGRRGAPPRPRRHGRGRQRRRPRVPEQPEQPDGDRARQQGRRRLRADGSAPRPLTRSSSSTRRITTTSPIRRTRARSRWRCRRPTSSWRERSRRRTAWPACASATPSVRRPTVKPMAQLKMPYNVSVFSVAAALAALADTKHIDDERARNTEVRAFTVKALDDLGCKSSDSQGNFLFVRHRPAGRGVPRRLRQTGDHGGPAVPAAREDPRAHLARHHGRDEESDGSVPQRAPAGDDDRRQAVAPRMARTTRDL